MDLGARADRDRGLPADLGAYLIFGAPAELCAEREGAVAAADVAPVTREDEIRRNVFSALAPRDDVVRVPEPDRRPREVGAAPGAPQIGAEVNRCHRDGAEAIERGPITHGRAPR